MADIVHDIAFSPPRPVNPPVIGIGSGPLTSVDWTLLVNASPDVHKIQAVEGGIILVNNTWGVSRQFRIVPIADPDGRVGRTQLVGLHASQPDANTLMSAEGDGVMDFVWIQVSKPILNAGYVDIVVTTASTIKVVSLKRL